MNDDELQRHLKDVAPLRGMFVTAMPDCLLFYSWTRESEAWSAEDVAAYLGDLIRANTQSLRALSSWSSQMQITVEASDVLLLLRELEGDFVVAFVFERGTPLGMLRLHVERILAKLNELLPKIRPEERPRGVRVAEFLLRYAPDAHTALQRAALQSGLPLDLLHDPEQLSPAQTERFETSVCAILGLDSLTL